MTLSSGCNAPRIHRADEAARFNTEMAARLAAVAIDPKHPLTLAQCEAIAIRNNLDYRVRLLQAQLQDDQVRLSLVGILPKITADVGGNTRNNDPLVKGPGGQNFAFQDKTAYSFDIRAVIPVFDFGATYFAYKIAKDRELQERLTVVRARQLLLRDVRIAYAQHAAAVRQEQLARVAVAAAQEVLRVATSLQREGLGSSADTAFVETALAQAGLELLLAQRRIEESHMRLNVTLSVTPWTPYEIDTTMPDAPALPSQERVTALEQTALTARPELWEQDLERHISANEVRHRITAFLPHIDGLAGFDWSTQSMQVNPTFASAGFAVGQTLLDGMSNVWRYDAAKKRVPVERERALLIAMGVLFDVDVRVLQVLRANASVLAQSKVSAAQETLLKEVSARYRENLENGANAARALAELRNAQRDLDQARTDYLAAWYELNAAALGDETIPAGEAAEKLDTSPAPLTPPSPADAPSDNNGTPANEKKTEQP
jgi:outer membrane protein TolC